MQYTFISIGKTKEEWLRAGLSEYLKRLERYTRYEWLELPDVKNSHALPQDKLKEEEAALLMSKIPATAHLILLDDKGTKYTSEALATKIEKLNNAGRDCVIVIGGAFGFGDKVNKRADERWSLSALTFSHQMVRLILAEQVYRAFTILKGEKYHHP